ncbi:MAG: hypothetical protein ACLQFR_26000 [Streptosporangiaceae bacterium]
MLRLNIAITARAAFPVPGRDSPSRSPNLGLAKRALVKGEPGYRAGITRPKWEQFKAAITDETGIKPHWSAEAFAGQDEDVRQSIRRIKASPLIPHTDSVRGFVFDVATGKLREVS